MMPPSALHPAPPWRRVLVEQYHAVGLAIRPTLAVAGSLAGALALVAGLAALRDGEGIAFVPEFALLAALAACLLPVAVWRGEYHVRRSYLASLPMNRARHVLAKLAGGWAWLMALTAAFMLGMLALALVTGGAIGVDEMRVLARDVPKGVAPEAATTYARRWTTPDWQWTTFFTTATVAYLLGSAVVLAGSRVRRWLISLIVLMIFCAILAEQGFGFGGVEVWVVEGLEVIVAGRYGLAALFAAADVDVLTTAAGEEVQMWRHLPTPGQWALTTLLWASLALATVLLVVGRDRRA